MVKKRLTINTFAKQPFADMKLVANLTSVDYGFDTFMMINDTFTVNNASYYGADFFTPDDHGTAHMAVISPNGDAMSATSTINTL